MCMFVIYVFNIFMFVLKFHAHRYIIIIHCNHTCEKYIFKKQIYFARKDHFSFFCHVITISPIWLKLSFFLYLVLFFPKLLQIFFGFAISFISQNLTINLQIFFSFLLTWNTKIILLQNSEAVAQRCSVKKVFLEISQNSQENTPVPETLF